MVERTNHQIFNTTRGRRVSLIKPTFASLKRYMRERWEPAILDFILTKPCV